VEGTDIITAVSGTCPNAVITVRGIPVSVNAATVFQAGSSCNALASGQRVGVRGVLTFAGGAISVLATRIHIEDAPERGPNNRAEVKGTVATVTGLCPAVTITLQGIPGTIMTNAATAFSPVGGCARIAVGTEIEAKGTLTAARQLTASELEIEDGDDEGRRRIEGEGNVGNLDGMCPTLSMIIRGIRVTTTASTVFENGACTDLRPGTKVIVQGQTQPNGNVIATLVRITEQPGRGGQNLVEGEGRVTSVQGTCPALTFVVQGQTVRTTAETQFQGGRCSAIRPNTKVDVRGFRDGSVIVAERVKFDEDDEDDDND